MGKKEKKICEKCGKPYFCDEHHILPKAIFGDGETKNLCKNCHDEFHRYLGHKYLQKENKQPMEFYIEKYWRWIVGLTIIIGIFLLTKSFVNFS